MPAARPFLERVNAIRALGADPMVTYPDGDINYPVTERVEKSLRTKRRAFGAAEPDTTRFPNHVLVEIREIQGDPQFCEYYYKFERLPGKEIYEESFDEETGAKVRMYRQRVAAGTALTALSTVKDTTFLVTDCTYQPISSVYGTLVTEAIVLPPSRTERKSVGCQFPARFTFITGWVDPPVDQHPRGPYPGVNYTLTAHRSASKPSQEVISYSDGPSGSVPSMWQVTTPGAASRVFPIGANTIHGGWTLYHITSSTLTIETITASTPSSYTPGDDLIIQASERRWKGNIWEKRVVTVEE